MEANTVSVHVLIALVGVIGSGLSVFIGLKVAMAEIKKDVAHLTMEVRKQEQVLERHIDPALHITREQLTSIYNQITNMRDDDKEAHSKIEHKVDENRAIMESIRDRLEVKIDKLRHP